MALLMSSDVRAFTQISGMMTCYGTITTNTDVASQSVPCYCLIYVIGKEGSDAKANLILL
jgi:hypothetical protein